jgi:hypothetical protein
LHGSLLFDDLEVDFDERRLNGQDELRSGDSFTSSQAECNFIKTIESNMENEVCCDAGDHG